MTPAIENRAEEEKNLREETAINKIGAPEQGPEKMAQKKERARPNQKRQGAEERRMFSPEEEMYVP
jgi:hypothetical protein